MSLQLRHGTFTEDILSATTTNQVTPGVQTIPVIQKGRSYYNSISGVSDNGQVPSNCNEMTFLNAGSSIVVINQVFSLYPGTIGSVLGDSITFDGKPGEIDVTIYEVNFQGAGINNCIVFRKIYQ